MLRSPGMSATWVVQHKTRWRGLEPRWRVTPPRGPPEQASASSTTQRANCPQDNEELGARGFAFEHDLAEHDSGLLWLELVSLFVVSLEAGISIVLVVSILIRCDHLEHVVLDAFVLSPLWSHLIRRASTKRPRLV